jgi:hypothetical protein
MAQKRLRRSIKLDTVNPRDFQKISLIYACEQCCHYSHSTNICTMGYIPQHRMETQLKLYNLTGKMAFCRFLEID